MNIYFTNEKEINSYVVLLPKITFKYCDNIDGRIYVKYLLNNSSKENDVIELISQLNPLIMTKKNVAILNLLVNPFFDELCTCIKTKDLINKRKKRIIKEYIFNYLGCDETNLVFSDNNIEGAEIYRGKNMFEKSREMLEIIK